MKMNWSSVWRRVRARADKDPYYAEFVLPAPSPNAYPKSIRGLRLAHAVTAGNEHRLATWWESRDAFDRESPGLRHSLGLPEASFAGLVHQIHEPKESRWKRLPWKTALLGLVAVLGALEALRNHYASLFEGPALRVQAERRPWHYVARHTIEENITLTNDTSVEHRDITIRARSNGGVESATMETTVVPSLSAGKTITLPLTATTAEQARSGSVVIDVTSTAGLWRKRETQAFEIPVRVWPATPAVSLESPKVEALRVVVNGEVRLGYAAKDGLMCVAEVIGEQPVRDVLVWMGEATGLGPWDPKTRSVTWTTRPIDAFRSPFFEVVIIPAGTSQWPAGAIDVRCVETITEEKK